MSLHFTAHGYTDPALIALRESSIHRQVVSDLLTVYLGNLGLDAVPLPASTDNPGKPDPVLQIDLRQEPRLNPTENPCFEIPLNGGVQFIRIFLLPDDTIELSGSGSLAIPLKGTSGRNFLTLVTALQDMSYAKLKSLLEPKLAAEVEPPAMTSPLNLV